MTDRIAMMRDAALFMRALKRTSSSSARKDRQR
jgi:hypothetical protein